MPDILSDKRPIKTVDMHPFGEDSTYYRLEHHGITKIEAYAEPGRGYRDVWIRVFKGDEVLFRVRAIYCQITYLIKES